MLFLGNCEAEISLRLVSLPCVTLSVLLPTHFCCKWIYFRKRNLNLGRNLDLLNIFFFCAAYCTSVFTPKTKITFSGFTFYYNTVQ